MVLIFRFFEHVFAFVFVASFIAVYDIDIADRTLEIFAYPPASNANVIVSHIQGDSMRGKASGNILWPADTGFTGSAAINFKLALISFAVATGGRAGC